VSDASAEDLAAFTAALSTAQPGDTVTLPAGRYAGDFTTVAAGTAEAPIIITGSSRASQRTVIDGRLRKNANYVQFRNVDIIYSGWTTRVSEDTASPAGVTAQLDIFGVGTKLINSVVRDTTGAIGLWTPATDAELYGVLVYNTGYQGTDRGHGHALYTQNDTGTKRIRNCVFAQGYSEWGVHAYTEGGSIQGFAFEDCVNYPAKFLVGGYTPVDLLTIRRSHLYGLLHLGFSGDVTNGSALVEDTTAATYQTTGTWGNRITGTGNRYGALGYNEVYVTANEYDDDRATVVIYNQALLNWISLDLSALPLTVGREYVLRNAQNYAEGYSFTYTGAAVYVPMTSWTVATPIGAASPLTASTFPERGCLLLERT
jgi:hypothetical protein